MKILIAGAQGMLGHDVVRTCLEHSHEVLATDINSATGSLDITSPEDIERVLSSFQPEWVINCAAFTNVDACEDHEEEAMILNARAPSLLAKACKLHSVRLLHVSTDYVFDGTGESPYNEENRTNPINMYGLSKREGEVAVAGLMDAFIIVRSQWLFGLHGKNFVSTIIRAARENMILRVVNDQHGSPTYTRSLASALVLLIEAGARGFYHVCNRGTATWFDLAKKTIEFMEMDTEVVPVTTEEFPRPARRPCYSVLSTMKFTETTGKLMPIWPISLKEYIQEFLHAERNKAPE